MSVKRVRTACPPCTLTRGRSWGDVQTLGGTRDLTGLQVSSGSTRPSPLESQEAKAAETRSRGGGEEGHRGPPGRKRNSGERGRSKFAHAGARTRARWPRTVTAIVLPGAQPCHPCPLLVSEAGTLSASLAGSGAGPLGGVGGAVYPLLGCVPLVLQTHKRPETHRVSLL